MISLRGLGTTIRAKYVVEAVFLAALLLTFVPVSARSQSATVLVGSRARAEYEYVGHKFLDVGNAEHPGQYEALPVGETRTALVRPFLDGRLQLGLDGMIALGYTGQTTETFAPGWQVGDLPPSCMAGVDGVTNDFDCGTTERAVGVRTVT